MDLDFGRMEEEMERMFREAQKMPGAKVQRYGPFVYGFSMRVGPDGKPIVHEFGNVPRGKREGVEEREPLVDVIDKDKEVSVIVELPGVDKQDIKLQAKGEALSVKVDTKERKYSKEIPLPAKVKPESAKATYKNGVLEVTLQKITPSPEKKREIKVE
ncbi:MAG: archaeal heat shock protein Hsp20 [Candidatus Micrarchaeota archaeon]